jgi:hypothetical protein
LLPNLAVRATKVADMQPAAPRKNHWTVRGRFVVFALAASSIGCLLADFYRLCPMHIFTPFIFVPAFLALVAFAVLDRLRGDGELWHAVMLGMVAGLLAAVAYDIFRLPFVFAKQWGIESVVPPLNLFKVFPRFGAMVLGQPIEQDHYSVAAQVIGWIYHFSNGATFGVMYLAMVGDGARRHWIWAVLFALGLELAMLLTPYPAVFGIHVTAGFIVATVLAHAIFGLSLWLCVQRLACRMRFARVPATP